VRPAEPYVASHRVRSVPTCGSSDLSGFTRPVHAVAGDRRGIRGSKRLSMRFQRSDLDGQPWDISHGR
jgi:hypothetical protein